MLAGKSSKKRQGWMRKLIDLSRRNNLLYFRPLKRGKLDLTSAKLGVRLLSFRRFPNFFRRMREFPAKRRL
jgi:hypothetical protein